MSRFNISPDEDSTGSSNSNEYGYPECTTKKAPISRVLLIAVSIFSLYSVHLLLKTANEGGSLLYEQLGYKAFGMPGKLAASLSITMQNIGAMSSYLYIVKYELPIVIQAFLGMKENTGEWYINGDYLVLTVSLLIILPLSLLRNLGYLGYTSGFSLLCMVFFVIVVIYKTFQISCSLIFENDALNATLNYTVAHVAAAVRETAVTVQNATADEDTCTTKYFVWNSQTVYAVPILTFAFVCHPAVLPIYEELKDRSRKRMQNVSNVSFFAMFVMYLLAALFGYITFGNNVEPELLHTYSKVYKFDVVLLIVRLAVLTAVTLTVPVVLFPTVYAVPILTFAFVCHPAVLPIYEELKDRSRKRMQNVSNVSFFAMFVMYLLAALFGYITFGNNVEPELLHTYSKVYKFDVVLLIVRLAVLTAVTLTVPVVLFPIRTSVNQLLCASKEFSWVRHTIITFVLLGFTNILVIFVPTIRDIFGFVGASAAAMLIFILPSAFYIKLVKKEPMKSVQKIGAVIFCISGFFVMIGSMTLIILDWTQNAAMADGH
ncbi:UNVERIFIED_CONTAM: hypothetical protein FKN15_018498 [Acipenser sinensis]